MINYLKHKEIDKAKWDECIDKSINRLVYAKSWFLDIVSPGWEALVENDYESVMPLPVKRKFFIPYLVQPILTQQLGIFSTVNLTTVKASEYLNLIPKKFVRQVFNLNSSNILTLTDRVSNRFNYELYLNRSYELIYQDYRENTRRNIKKAANHGVVVEILDETDLFMKLYERFAKDKPNHFIIERLRKIMNYALEHQKGEVVFAKDGNEQMMGGAFFLEDLGRMIYLVSFISPKGQTCSAMFRVMDEMIKKHAMNPVILDFEGSMIPGIARFFAGFGAEKKVYQQYRKSLKL